jgi:hypothetical protein
MALADRIYTCKNCGVCLNRDHNSARNMVKLGLTGVFGAKIPAVNLDYLDEYSSKKLVESEIPTAAMISSLKKTHKSLVVNTIEPMQIPDEMPTSLGKIQEVSTI